MKKGVSLTTALILLSSVAYAGGDKSILDVVPIQLNKESFFIYAAGGITGADVASSLRPNINVFLEALDDSGSVWEAGVGYRYTKDVFTTLSIQGASLDLIDMYNYNASINYRFSDLFIMPYFGAIIGYSNLEWQEIPVDTTGRSVEAKLDADHVTFGFQAGADYEITDNFTLFGKYQYLNYDHMMEIFQASDINHANMQHIQGGVRYEF